MKFRNTSNIASRSSYIDGEKQGLYISKYKINGRGERLNYFDLNYGEPMEIKLLTKAILEDFNEEEWD